MKAAPAWVYVLASIAVVAVTVAVLVWFECKISG